MSLDINNVIGLTIEVPQLPPATPSLQGVCIFGKSTKLATYEKVKYFTPDTLASRFSASDPEYKAAMVAFAQNPSLSGLYIARRFASAQAGVLLGGAHAVLADLQAITAGAFDITVDTTTIHVTALDLSGCANLEAVATAVQSKLAAGLASTTCTYTADGFFLVTSPTTGTSSQVSFATSAGTDTTSADLLGLTVEEGARRAVGFAAETVINDTLTAAKVYNSSWFSFACARDANLTDLQNASDWALANKSPMAATTNSPAAYATPTSGDTDIAGYIKRKANKYTFATYSTDTPDAGAGALARIAVVDYTQYRSVITLWGKAIGGVSGESIDQGIYDGLRAKNCNVVAPFGANSPIFTYGTMGDGTYIDQVFGLAWLDLEIKTQIYAAMTAMGRLAQTDEDVALLVTAFETALRKAVNNGLLAPGYWPSTVTGIGTVKPGGYLKEGFYVYAEPISSMSEADRNTRVSPPITALATGSGAIQKANLKLIFSP
jgi:hypothetical protein